MDLTSPWNGQIKKCRSQRLKGSKVQAFTVVVVVYLNGWAGFGRGRRRWKMRGKLGLDLVREGWEPLVQRCHWCFSTQPGVALTLLRDLKGNTARAKLGG